MFLNAFSNKTVWLSGHTGFKGTWLAEWLLSLGAKVHGFSLPPPTNPSMFDQLGLADKLEHTLGDVRDLEAVRHSILDANPDFVFHLAAQPLVRLSYDDPIGTYETNVIGTARVLDAIRRTPSVRAVVSVTTDKVYENHETLRPYVETDPLGGYDPYSSSKACAEIVSAAYRQSYFPVAHLAEHKVALATARAGNVIGGGDWALDRLIPDLVRGFLAGEPVCIRRPFAIRPWQHVLEPLHGYISLAEHLLSDDPARYATAYNFGPHDDDARPVGWIVDKMTSFWGDGASWFLDQQESVHEAGYLKLDASRARADLNWTPHLNLETALEWLVKWYRAWQAGADMNAFTLAQIAAYESLL
jgi:CDP-glucose 4,6-dehydratase